MNTLAVTLRKMQEADIAAAMKLSEAEGWNQSAYDWKIFVANEQNICMLASYDDQVIGTTTAMNYEGELAWIAMVLVDKKYRGKGISKLLLENMLEQLAAFRSVKLDATAAGQKVYSKFGFNEEYVIARMVNPAVNNVLFKNDESVAQVQPKDLPAIVALDQIAFGAGRKVLIESLIKEYPHKAWVIKQDDLITGFALGRVGSRYHHIGPVIASNFEDAGKLIGSALQELTEKPVVVDVLCDKENLVHSLQQHGFERQRDFVRMYKNENLSPGATDQYYLICGPEFG